MIDFANEPLKKSTENSVFLQSEVSKPALYKIMKYEIDDGIYCLRRRRQITESECYDEILNKTQQYQSLRLCRNCTFGKKIYETSAIAEKFLETSDIFLNKQLEKENKRNFLHTCREAYHSHKWAKSFSTNFIEKFAYTRCNVILPKKDIELLCEKEEFNMFPRNGMIYIKVDEKFKTFIGKK